MSSVIRCLQHFVSHTKIAAQMNRGIYNTSTTTRTPNDVLTLIGRIQSTYKRDELHLLMFLIDMALDNFSKAVQNTKLPEPRKNQNLNIILYEKCCAIRTKNNELKIKLLNLHAVFAKHFYNNRKVQFEKQYQGNFENIQEKSSSIREKIAKLKKKKLANCKSTNNASENTKAILINLKEVTETLAHQTIKARVQFRTLVDFLPDPEMDYN